MAQQIKKKFLAPEVIDYFDDQIDSLEQSVQSETGRLDQEILDRAQGDSDTLDSAKSYTDAEVLTEKEARELADSALDERVVALEEFGYDQVIYVSKNGVDTNDGKQHSPFLTISAALNSISDATPSKRYVLKVLPGNYSESSLALKANVYIVGQGQKESVRITGAVSMGPSFTQSSSFDNRSGLSNVVLLSAANFDWNEVQSAAGKLYFHNVIFGSTVNMYGYNNAIAQAQFASCIIYGDLTISGINVGVFTNNVCFNNVTLNQHPGGGMATILNATGGYCNILTQIAPVNDFNRRCATFLRNFNSEKLVIDGPAVYADVDLVSQGKQTPEISNGANLVAFNPRINHDITTGMIVPKNTNSHNMGDWGRQWTWNFGYVHASTGTDLFLISYPSSYEPDSSGKSIGIYTDGAGLQENVDGGNIQVATAETSGTGVRGIVQLDGRHIDVSSKQIKSLADGTDSSDAVNKGQLDAAIAAIPEVDLSGYYTKTEVDSIGDGLQGQIDTEKGRIDAILLAADADKDSFAEIVSLINSVDTENDQAFGAYVLSNDAALAQEVSDRQAADALKVSKSGDTMNGILEIQNGGLKLTQLDVVADQDIIFDVDMVGKILTFQDNITGNGGYFGPNVLSVLSTENGAISLFDGQASAFASDMASPQTPVNPEHLTTKKYVDDSIAAIPEVDLTNYYTKLEVDSKESALDSRLDVIEAKGFSKGSLVVGEELAYIDLDREYQTILSVSVGRLAVHEGEDYTVSVVGGVTRLTWIGSLINPDGAEAIETGDKVFWAGSF